MYVYMYILMPIIRSASCNLLHGTPVIRTVTTTNSTCCLQRSTRPSLHHTEVHMPPPKRFGLLLLKPPDQVLATPGSDLYSDCDTLRTTKLTVTNKRNKLLKIPKEDGNRTPCEHRPNGVRLQVLQPRLLFWISMGFQIFLSFCRAKKRQKDQVEISWKLLKTIHKSIQLFFMWLVGWLVMVCALQLRLRAAKKDESVKRGPFATAAEAAMMAILETTWNNLKQKMTWLFCPLQCSFVLCTVLCMPILADPDDLTSSSSLACSSKLSTLDAQAGNPLAFFIEMAAVKNANNSKHVNSPQDLQVQATNSLQRSHESTWANMSQHESTWVNMSQHESTWVNMSQHESTWVNMSQHYKHCTSIHFWFWDIQ